MSKNVKNVQIFSSRLREVRVKQGMTQAELGEKLGFSGNTAVYRFEAGVSSPSIEMLTKVAEVLAVDLHWLITGGASPVENQLLGKFHDALDRFAPYVGDAITRLFEEKAELTAKRKALSVRRLEDKEEQAIRLKLLDKDIAKVQEWINQTVKDLDYIQNPFGDGSSAQATIVELEGLPTRPANRAKKPQKQGHTMQHAPHTNVHRSQKVEK